MSSLSELRLEVLGEEKCPCMSGLFPIGGRKPPGATVFRMELSGSLLGPAPENPEWKAESEPVLPNVLSERDSGATLKMKSSQDVPLSERASTSAPWLKRKDASGTLDEFAAHISGVQPP